jgi:hypothetical protein
MAGGLIVTALLDMLITKGILTKAHARDILKRVF